MRGTDSNYYDFLEDHLRVVKIRLLKILWRIRVQQASEVIIPHRVINKSQKVSDNQCTHLRFG